MMNSRKKNALILSLVWFIFGIISSLSLYDNSIYIFLLVILFALGLYWTMNYKYGYESITNGLINAKAYAPILEITNLLLGIRSLKKENAVNKAIPRYRLLCTLAISGLIISYFLSQDLDLFEKLGSIIIYSPFIFFIINGHKKAYLFFLMLITFDALAFLLSGGKIIDGTMKWLILSLVTTNAYLVESMKK
ncbi:MAG: hypothetical protein PHE89_05270 [Alphaproteobacteria bacterium]|nr:hypothetical protein [Alphaproteobacteria bacterium]